MVNKTIDIEICYAHRDKQVLLPQKIAAGTAVGEAIKQSGILEQCPDIDLTVNKVGIFGKVCRLDQIINDTDRIEIYRPLIADPKAIRRQRARQVRKGAIQKSTSG